ncbi:MAG: hypothetical protein F4Y26_08905 [Gammaproteobacteria bacterium]|nr:hypothetical protein [Gammaproteobacteria bacterium]
MADEPAPAIAGVNDKELAAVAGLSPALPNVRTDDPDQFAEAVRLLVERRAQGQWPGESCDDVAVFVLTNYPRQAGKEHGGVPFLDPARQGTPLLGRLFFSNRHASHGQFIQIPTTPNALLEWLDDNGFADCPVVTVYRDAKEMVTRRHGIHSDPESDRIRDQEPMATTEELRDALLQFHVKRVLTPSGGPAGIWDNPSQYIPGPQPERSIQSELELALSFWFRGVVKVECEDSTNIGRIDVRLLKASADGGGLSYWVILELKVIKSYTHTGVGVGDAANVDSIVEGVQQAGSYRANRLAEVGMLEIYDQRRDKSADLTARQPVVDARASYSPPPDIHVWPVFGSARDARRAGHTGA